MNEFEQRKKEVLQPIFFEAGAALYDCQAFEYDIAYLLFQLSRTGITELKPEKVSAILDDDEKKTAGQLIGMLKKQLPINESMKETLATALKARNKLIHRQLIENVERMIDVNEHPKMVKEISKLRSTVRRCSKELAPIIVDLTKILDGIDIDELSDQYKGKFMEDTNA